jgi:hypothetical protein
MGAVIGIIILLIGIIFLIGNVSGWWLSFPYAGFIIMSLGLLIIKVSRDD